MAFSLSFRGRYPDRQREAEQRESGQAAPPAAVWFSLIKSGVLLLALGVVLRGWIPPLKMARRPLFGMPLTQAGQCLSGAHILTRIGQGLFVCQGCHLVCACPYCVSHIPAGMPFVTCAYHQGAPLELQDAVLPTTAITLKGRRV